MNAKPSQAPIQMPILLLITAALFYFTPHSVWRFVQVLNGFFAVGLIAIIASPLGNRKLTTPSHLTQDTSLKNRFLHIAILQISILALFLGSITLINHQLPFGSAISNVTLLNSMNLAGLLFPWPMIALLACLFAIMAFNQQRDAYLSKLLFPLMKAKMSDYMGIQINADNRLAMFTMNLVSISMLILALTYFLSNPSAPFFSGFNPVLLITLGGLCVFTFTDYFKPISSKLCSKPFNVTTTYWLMAIGLSLFLLIVFWLFADLQQLQFSLHWLNDIVKQVGKPVIMQLITLGWWIVFTPFISLVIARSAYGLTLRTTCLISLILPLCFAIVLYFFQNQLHWLQNTTLSAILIIIGFVGLSCYCGMKKYRASLIQGYAVQSGQLKIRSHHLYFRKIAQFTALTLYLILPGGTVLLSFGLLMVSIPLIIVMIGLISTAPNHFSELIN